MRACGIGAYRVLAPALLFGLTLSGAAYVLSEHVTPWARHARRVSIRESILELLRLPPPGIQRFSLGTYKLSYVDFVDGRLEKPSLIRFSKGGPILNEYHAPSGRIVVEQGSLKIVMSRPRYVQYDPVSGQEHRFEAQSDVEIPLEIEEYREPGVRLEDYPGWKLHDLYLDTDNRRIRAEIRLILHTRYAQSAAPLLLVLVAAPIGIWVRKGSRLAGLGAALPPLLVYFIAFFVSQGLGEKGRLPTAAAAWLPDALLALPAALFLWRSRR